MIHFEILGEEKLVHCWRCERDLPSSSFITMQCIDCTKELEELKPMTDPTLSDDELKRFIKNIEKNNLYQDEWHGDAAFLRALLSRLEAAEQAVIGHQGLECPCDNCVAWRKRCGL